MPHRFKLGLFLLFAATLAFEITLTRLFSVVQFYHFAFMIVSIALLGSGASGTALAIFPALRQADLPRSLSALGLATGASLLGAYLLTNWLPFDSFSIAWDSTQVLVLVLHYIALATPFFFSGMALGLLLDAFPGRAGQTYGVNFLGSALGCLLALVAPAALGAEGVIVLCSGLAALSALVFLPKLEPRAGQPRVPAAVIPMASTLLLAFALLAVGVRLSGRSTFPFLELKLSPYKGLSYALQQPGTQEIFQGWNSFSRLDVVRSPSLHSIPGLSYRYLEALPQADGLFVDGDDLSPILPAPAEDEAGSFTDYLPAAAAYHLRPGASALVLEPRGGLDIYAALRLGARQITAVEANPLVIEATQAAYRDPQVQVVNEEGRSYLRRTPSQFDIVQLSLASSFHPVRSGAYSLAEDYRYTLESFQDILKRLKPGGLFVVTRWLQDPPSEDLRTFALAVTALENMGGEAQGRVVAFRGYNTLTVLARNGAFTSQELDEIRAFTAQRAFDLVYAPNLQAEETNRYNILPAPIYYQAFSELLAVQPRQAFYASYPYDVTPPTDDHPFFGHYFKWSQAGQVLAELGRTWQPFGGAGYFVLAALLLLAIVLSLVLILLPLAVRQQPDAGTQESTAAPLPYFLYFALIGFAFLLVEIPLIQRFILYLGQPAYAMTAVLFTLLLFSGLGSSASGRLDSRHTLGVLTALVLAVPWLLPALFERTLGQPFALRLALTVVLLAPAGFLMGIPFPAGIQHLRQGFARRGRGAQDNPSQRRATIPWLWAVNGASSVTASILAALLALSFGFSWVLWAGALCYAGAWLVMLAMARPNRSRSLAR